uniref:hypothetical protein n=1 Tax=Streptomyces corallincola TaxID=2851888 RepID=UPI0027E2D4F4|nr:hypothetical protein [Streptomyces corallincola]
MLGLASLDGARGAASDSGRVDPVRPAGARGDGPPAPDAEPLTGARTGPPAAPGDVPPTRSAPGARADGSAPAHSAPPARPPADPGTDTPARPRRPAPRRGAADPVKALLHRHRELCERAVDPLEIAAGLEAHGVTDRTAARFRHRDVFSLAEELYARVPRDGAAPAGFGPAPAPRVRAGRVLLAALPGAVGAAAVAGLRLTEGRPRALVALAAVLALGLAVRAVLRHGPLAAAPGGAPWRTASATRVWTVWLLGYALLGDGFVRVVTGGGPDALPTGAPDAPWATATAPVLALALSCVPAALAAHLLAAGARRRLAGSRGLGDFTSAARPLLLGTVAVYVAALAGLLALCGAVLGESPAYPQALTLGTSLLLGRLLVTHGHRYAPAVVLGVMAGGEVLAPALLLAGRLPGCAFLAAPVEALTSAWGAGAVPVLACAGGAVALLAHALRTLTRASAYARGGADG